VESPGGGVAQYFFFFFFFMLRVQPTFDLRPRPANWSPGCRAQPPCSKKTPLFVPSAVPGGKKNVLYGEPPNLCWFLPGGAKKGLFLYPGKSGRRKDRAVLARFPTGKVACWLFLMVEGLVGFCFICSRWVVFVFFIFLCWPIVTCGPRFAEGDFGGLFYFYRFGRF